MNRVRVLLSFFAIATTVLAGCDEEDGGFVGKIYVKALGDHEGPTSELFHPYKAAISDFVTELNKVNGIGGYEIMLEYGDDEYTGDAATRVYNKWRAADEFADVVTLFGWGTPPSLALTPLITEDKMPYISASYSGSLTSPTAIGKTVDLQGESVVPGLNEDGTPKAAVQEWVVATQALPYNYFPGTDYTTGARLAVKFADQYDFENGTSGRSITFAYCLDSAYCYEPVAGGKLLARELGMTILPDVHPPMRVSADERQAVIDDIVEAYFTSGHVSATTVHWFWIGNTTSTTVAFVKAVKKYLTENAIAVDIGFLCNVWGFSERIEDLCGEDCRNNVFGVMPFSAYGDTRLSGMQNVIDYHDRNNSADDGLANVRYVQGHATFLMWKIAIENLIAAKKEITRRNVRGALDDFKKVTTGGLMAPITFTASDHRPTTGAQIYSINEFGKLEFKGEVVVDRNPDEVGW